jgi:surfactin synthase thioesterase subunit
MYLRWRRRLPSWVQVEPIELPGRGSRLDEAAEKHFNALTANLCKELEKRVTGFPEGAERYALFGHSMGALLAYRIARGLYAANRPLPIALLVSACAAPSRQDWRRYADKKTDASLIAELRKQNGTPEEVFENPELLSMTLDLLGADYQACASFRHQESPPLSLPIHVFGGQVDEIKAVGLEAWQKEGAGNFSLDWFDGGHFFIRQNEDVFLSVLVSRLAGDVGELPYPLSQPPHALHVPCTVPASA